MAMRLARHNEATKALWLSVAGVMVIALGWNVIVLILKLY